MPSAISQHLARLYDTYAGDEVTFNNQVILASGLLPADVRLTVGDDHIPCILYGCSMKGAKVIAELGDAVGARLERNGNSLSLRLAFRRKEDPAPVVFFVSSRVESRAEYNPQKPQTRFLTLEFTHRPADALIEVLGSLLEINSNAARRKDERIVITPESMKKIGMESKESCVAIEGAPRRCIVRDLSFGGAKVLVTGVAEPRAERKVLLKLNRCEMKDDTILDGSIVRVEDVEGRSDVVALSIQFTSEPPISYKQKINGYFGAQGGE